MAASWIGNARLADGSRVAVAIDGEAIADIAERTPAGAPSFDAEGKLLVPAFTDAHVHLGIAADLRLEAETLLRGGVAGVLDLGISERLVPSLRELTPLHVTYAGPLLTARKGYPTQSWGADGYGLEIETADEARRAVAHLAALGSRAVKLAFDGRFPVLDRAAARAAAEEAHRRGLLVFAHALDPSLVAEAVAAGTDVLAHAPTGRLPDHLVREIGAKRLRVVSTLHAYGGEGIENLRRLRAAGAVVAYGTDLGNEGTSPGIDAEELSLLEAAGLTFQAVLEAVRESARLACASGTISRGARADLLLVPEESLAQPVLLARPARIWIAGSLRLGGA
ncbi:MAG: amidohydrolase family protein [Myxococcales bacterium]